MPAEVNAGFTVDQFFTDLNMTFDDLSLPMHLTTFLRVTLCTSPLQDSDQMSLVSELMFGEASK